MKLLCNSTAPIHSDKDLSHSESTENKMSPNIAAKIAKNTISPAPSGPVNKKQNKPLQKSNFKEIAGNKIRRIMEG